MKLKELSLTFDPTNSAKIEEEMKSYKDQNVLLSQQIETLERESRLKTQRKARLDKDLEKLKISLRSMENQLAAKKIRLSKLKAKRQ